MEPREKRTSFRVTFIAPFGFTHEPTRHHLGLYVLNAPFTMICATASITPRVDMATHV